MMMLAGGIFAMYSLMCKRLGIGQYAHRIPTDVDKARCVLCLCLFLAGSYSLVCHLVSFGRTGLSSLYHFAQ